MKNYYKMTTRYKADQTIISGCGQKYHMKSFQKAGGISFTFIAIYEELKLEAAKKKKNSEGMESWVPCLKI